MRGAHASIRRSILAVALLALIATPAADADETFTGLPEHGERGCRLQRRSSPPGSPRLGSDEFIDASGGSTAGVAQYNLRFSWRKRDNPFVFRAIVSLQRGRVRSLGVLRRQLRGYTVRPTRVRGRGSFCEQGQTT